MTRGGDSVRSEASGDDGDGSGADPLTDVSPHSSDTTTVHSDNRVLHPQVVLVLRIPVGQHGKDGRSTAVQHSSMMQCTRPIDRSDRSRSTVNHLDLTLPL